MNYWQLCLYLYALRSKALTQRHCGLKNRHAFEGKQSEPVLIICKFNLGTGFSHSCTCTSENKIVSYTVYTHPYLYTVIGANEKMD